MRYVLALLFLAYSAWGQWYPNLSSGTWLNQEGATLTQTPGKPPVINWYNNNGLQHCRALMFPLPSPPYTATLITGITSLDVSQQETAGMLLYDPVSLNFRAMNPQWELGKQGFDGAYGTDTTVDCQLVHTNPWGINWWFPWTSRYTVRMLDDGTHRTVYYSSDDGKTWTLFIQEASGTGVVPTEVGIFGFTLGTSAYKGFQQTVYYWDVVPYALYYDPIEEPSLARQEQQISFVAATQAAGSSSGNGVTGTFSTSTAGANLIAACVADDPRSTFSAANLTDNYSNSYTCGTAYTSYPGLSAETIRLRACWAQNATGGAGHTITYTKSTSYPAIQAFAFANAATTSVSDTGTGALDNTYTDTSLASGFITPSQTNELYLTCGASGTITWPNTPTTSYATYPYELSGNWTYGGGSNAKSVAGAFYVSNDASARQGILNFSGAAYTIINVIEAFKPSLGTAQPVKMILP